MLLLGPQCSWGLLWVLLSVTALSSEQTGGAVPALEPGRAPLVTQGHMQIKKLLKTSGLETDAELHKLSWVASCHEKSPGQPV